MRIIDSGFKLEKSKTDVLIIGSGGAALRAAVESARSGMQVVVVCRSPLGKGGLTPTGNGGYHGAVWPGDSPAIHAEDLVTMGCRLNDRNLVQALTEESVSEARQLEELGAKVNWDIPPRPAEPQMRFPRSLFIPGREILSALGKHLKKQSNVVFLEDHLAIRLMGANNEVTGAALLNIKEGSVVVYESKVTVLATGSLGEVYPLTGQEPMGIPTGSTGSGYVLAGWAGAEMVDMEMVQFVIMPVAPPLVRGMRFIRGGTVLNREGESFLSPEFGAYSHEAAQAVYREIHEGRGPICIVQQGQKSSGPKRHPLLGLRIKNLQRFEATPSQRPVEVSIGMLFMMGGVHINAQCETNVKGLYAAGEVTGNVHGARRVSGNAFPEIIVFGARAGKHAAQAAQKVKFTRKAPKVEIERVLDYLTNLVRGGKESISPGEVRQKVKSIMGQHAYVMRSGDGLRAALEELSGLAKDLHLVRIEPAGGLAWNPRIIEGIDARWLLEVSQVICHAALLREESRGFHFREDFPLEDEEWLKHTMVRFSGSKMNEWSCGTKPIA
ncbi:FAD-binding protein [Thermodesulfobacteriota bacterium]